MFGSMTATTRWSLVDPTMAQPPLSVPSPPPSNPRTGPQPRPRSRAEVGEPDRIAYRSAEVAAMLGVDQVRVQRWLVNGTLPGRKIGGLWFVYADDLEAMLRTYDAGDARPQ